MLFLVEPVLPLFAARLHLKRDRYLVEAQILSNLVLEVGDVAFGHVVRAGAEDSERDRVHARLRHVADFEMNRFCRRRRIFEEPVLQRRVQRRRSDLAREL